MCSFWCGAPFVLPPHPSMNRQNFSFMSAQPRPAQRASCDACATQGMCPLAGLESGMFAAVENLVKERVYRRTDVLLHQGQAVDILRVVKSGAVLWYRGGTTQADFPVAMLGAGHIVGAVGLTDLPAILTVVAASETRVCEVALGDMQAIGILQAPAFHRAMGQAVFTALASLADWARVGLLKGVQTRLAGALLLLGAQQQSIRVRLPAHAVLGEMLGMTRESVVRAIVALEQEGCIIRQGRSYCELNPSALRRLCYPSRQ